MEVFNFIFDKLVKIKEIEILRIGDDLGFKSSTMISSELLKKYVFPVYKNIAEISHNAKKPFILHSCGNLKNVMDDLIDYCKIDAKHSFEDVIMPITEALRIWGKRISLLGGIDLDYLVRRTENEIKNHTKKKVMDEGSRYKSFAIGNGNTIANYIPINNFLAMLEATKEFNVNN